MMKTTVPFVCAVLLISSCGGAKVEKKRFEPPPMSEAGCLALRQRIADYGDKRDDALLIFAAVDVLDRQTAAYLLETDIGTIDALREDDNRDAIMRKISDDHATRLRKHSSRCPTEPSTAAENFRERGGRMPGTTEPDIPKAKPRGIRNR